MAATQRAGAPDGDMDAAAERGDLRPYHAALAAYWAAMLPSSPPEEMATHAAFYALRAAGPASEAAAQGRLLDDILGRPSALTQPDPRWLTSTVVSVARGIYEEKAFDRLPILADALEDAGCDSADIVAHCRGDGPHVRGCWVVDLILGRR